MRLLLLLASLAATPVVAQDFGGLTQSQIDDLRAQQQLAQQRMIAQENELRAIESRLRTEQAVAEQQAARAPFRLPEPIPGAPPRTIPIEKLPSISDAALAESNRRVREAAKNRR